MSHGSDDCYFYYYSTCNKGDSCEYRHESDARGTEQICEDWEFGKCVKIKCNLRHMRIQVKRKGIQCYWELQPSGCQKTHCMFRHTKSSSPRLSVNQSDGRIERTLTNHISTDREYTDVPSPKVKPVLISMADTDEDSPQKKRRIKKETLSVSRNSSLPQLTSPDSDANLTGESERIPQESDMLTEEILNSARKGNTASHSPLIQKTVEVKRRSLRDLKREKILRARLEFEQKKKAVAAQKHRTEVKSPSSHQENGSSSTSLNTKQSTEQHLGSSCTQKNCPSPKLEVPNPVELQSIKKIQVKSFSEIIEGKRRQRRLHESKPVINSHCKHSNVSVNTDSKNGVGSQATGRTQATGVAQATGSTQATEGTQATGETVSSEKVVIPPRKIKIHSKSFTSSRNSKPVRLKRPALVNSNDEEQAKVPKQPVPPSSPLVILSGDDLGNLDVVSTANSSAEPEVERLDCLSESQPGLEVTGRPESPQFRPPAAMCTHTRLEEDIERELLESAELAGNTTPADDVDVDELFNEMEHLLA